MLNEFNLSFIQYSIVLGSHVLQEHIFYLVQNRPQIKKQSFQAIQQPVELFGVVYDEMVSYLTF